MNTESLAFSVDETARLTGLRTQRIRRWAKDLYAPTWGSGLYTFRDLVALRALAMLRDAGVSRQALVKAGRYLSKRFDEPWSRLRFGVSGRKLYFWDADIEHWVGAAEGQLMMAHVELGRIAPRMERDVRRSRRRDPSTFGQFAKTRGICGSRQCVAGTRVTVESIRHALRSGASVSAILRAFPSLKRQDVLAVQKLSAA